MDWANEPYVRLYTQDTVDDRLLDWRARALWHELLRKFDRAGIVELKRRGARGIAALVMMPLDVVEPALAQLLEDGRVEIRGSWLFCPNFRDAQGALRSEAQRARDHRAKVAAEARLELLPPRQLFLPAFSEPRDEPVTSRVATTAPRDATVTVSHNVSLSADSACSADSALHALPDPDPEPPIAPHGGPDPSGSDFRIAEGTKPNGRTNGAGRERAPTPAEREVAERVLRKLSERAERRYTGDAHVRLIVRLLRQGYTEREIKLVIWDRANEWQGDEKMDRYVRPKTLFAPSNFADYLPEAEAAYAKQEAAGGNGVRR